MIIDYNTMKKSRDPYFELLSNNDIALYIDHLTFIGENGLIRFIKYSMNKVKNIYTTMLVLELSEQDTFLLLDEKFKYESVRYQFDNMLDQMYINKNIIGIKTYENRFKENQTSTKSTKTKTN